MTEFIKKEQKYFIFYQFFLKIQYLKQENDVKKDKNNKEARVLSNRK
jgi:hypothetical protein